MVKKISRKKCIEQYNQLAHIEENDIFENGSSFYPHVHGSYTLTYKAESFKEHVAVFATEITLLAKEFGHDSLLFFPNEDRAWVQDPGDVEALMDAVNFLFEYNVPSGFDGGLRVSVELLPEFLGHLMMMAHYGDHFPTANFIDEQQSFLCSICAHGNIHVDILTTDIYLLSIDAIEKSRLSLIESNQCHAIYNNALPLENPAASDHLVVI